MGHPRERARRRGAVRDGPPEDGATANTAILFTTNTVLSSLVGVIYLDDRVRPGFTVPAIVGFVCAIAGAVGTAHYASIATPRRRRRT